MTSQERPADDDPTLGRLLVLLLATTGLLIGLVLDMTRSWRAPEAEPVYAEPIHAAADDASVEPECPDEGSTVAAESCPWAPPECYTSIKPSAHPVAREPPSKARCGDQQCRGNEDCNTCPHDCACKLTERCEPRASRHRCVSRVL